MTPEVCADDGGRATTWHPVSRLQIRARILTALGWCALPVGVGAVLAVVVSPWWWFLAGPFALILVTTAASAPFTIPRIRWAERDTDLVVATGWLSRETTAVPYHRLQMVGLTEGPLDQHFGLAQLTFRTAAQSISIPGLPKNQADALRDRLVARGVRLRKDDPAPTGTAPSTRTDAA